ncbi:MAG: hypothetical protein NTY02_18115 [Acidobacteria bacterium]|nr:hypothetical protein [Acidobacteriota bacterium]
MRRWTDVPFIVGANLPWLSYGNDFGASAWQPDGGVGAGGRRTRLREALRPLSAGGLSVVRWFLFCDGRAGLVTGGDGGVVGLDAYVWRDIDAALDELDRAGLRAIFVLVDFHWFKPAHVVQGVQLGGRARWLIDPVQRARVFDCVLAPLFDRYGQSPAVVAWDIVNEPEWVTGRVPWMPWRRRVSRRDMRAFIGDTVSLLHERTVHPATVGSTSTRSLPLVQGLGLDLYQAHWYDPLELRAPLGRPVAELDLDRPILLGEFPTRGSGRSPDAIVDTARGAGYAGALAWSALASDSASGDRRWVPDHRSGDT